MSFGVRPSTTGRAHVRQLQPEPDVLGATRWEPSAPLTLRGTCENPLQNKTKVVMMKPVAFDDNSLRVELILTLIRISSSYPYEYAPNNPVDISNIYYSLQPAITVAY